MSNCTNCGRPIGPGGAQGLDARCYVYRRRNGYLPPAQMLQAKGLTERFVIRLTPRARAAISENAKAMGLQDAEWVRLLIAAATVRP